MRNKFVLLAVILLTIILFTVYNLGEKEIIIIPYKYKGVVKIYFDRIDGQPIKYEGGSRLYEIPPTGLLKTKFKVNSGWRRSHEAFYVRSDGQRIPLNDNYEVKEYNPQVGSFQDSLSGASVYFMTFIISTQFEIDSLYKTREKTGS